MRHDFKNGHIFCQNLQFSAYFFYHPHDPSYNFLPALQKFISLILIVARFSNRIFPPIEHLIFPLLCVIQPSFLSLTNYNKAGKVSRAWRIFFEIQIRKNVSISAPINCCYGGVWPWSFRGVNVLSLKDFRQFS